jgi:hypothetical protein
MVRRVCHTHLDTRPARRLTRAIARLVPDEVWGSEDTERIREAESVIRAHIDEARRDLSGS